MKKLYIGCSLTHASEEFKKEIAELKARLKTKYEILEFTGLEHSTAQDVYHHDTEQVKNCDLFLAECSHPATGLGFEIATALNHHKPILAVAKKGSTVSRLILGIDSTLFSFVLYETSAEIVDAVEKKLAGII